MCCLRNTPEDGRWHLEALLGPGAALRAGLAGPKLWPIAATDPPRLRENTI